MKRDTIVVSTIVLHLTSITFACARNLKGDTNQCDRICTRIVPIVLNISFETNNNGLSSVNLVGYEA
jgi:hypothetical protein